MSRFLATSNRCPDLLGLRSDSRLAALVFSFGPRLGDAFALTLQHYLPLKLRDCGEDRQLQSRGRVAAVAAGVQAHGLDYQADATLSEVGFDRQQVSGRTGQPVRLGDHE